MICDDQAIVRDGLELLLKLEKDFEVVGVAQDGAQAVEFVDRVKPDLVLMDLMMPGVNGVEATRQIHTAHPDVKILVLTTFDDDEWVFDAVRAGASGYLLKDTPRARVIEAIRGTLAGKSFVDPAVAGKLLEHAASPQLLPATQITSKLTDREIEVLRLIGNGLNNSDIAGRLHLSEGTVRNHVSAILLKLGVSDRTQAAILAIRHGLDQAQAPA
jgi:DNA-binding NarL/FixJ family response regulator